MITITPAEISKFRAALQDNDEALEAIDIVENCDGNLEESMNIVMNMDNPDRSDDDWIDIENFVKEFHNIICNPKLRKLLSDEDFLLAFGYFLGNIQSYSVAIKIILFLFVVKKGIDHFCPSKKSS